MSTSARKARANGLNAQKSTGPKTDAGKEISRANALKHGLSGAGVVVTPREAAAVATRMEAWRSDYQVDSAIKEWAFEQLAANSVRINLCQDDEYATRHYDAVRASLAWEIDQEAGAAVLGDRLARKPEVVAKQLTMSKYGCLWLIEQWTDLRGVLEAGETWNDGQLQRALDLAGMSRQDRDELAPLDDPMRLVKDKCKYLEELIIERHELLDNLERANAERGIPVASSKKIALLRRYEAACVKRMESAQKMLGGSALECLEVSAKPRTSAPKPEPPDTPKFDPFSDEINQRMAESKAFAAYNKAWEAAPESERAALMPDLPASLLSERRLSDAVPAPAAPYGRPMNRKQRKALAKLTAQAK